MFIDNDHHKHGCIYYDKYKLNHYGPCYDYNNRVINDDDKSGDNDISTAHDFWRDNHIDC
jgi:hypothetical protein